MKKLLTLLLVMVLSLSSVGSILAEESPYLLEAVSEDWNDYQFTLNGQAYQLPLPVSIFVEDGWKLEDSDTLLSPNQYTFSQALTKDGMKLNVQLLNAGIDVMPLSECLVGQINIEDKESIKDGAFALAGGVTFGTTKDEASGLYGTPKDVYEGSLYEKVTYSTDTYASIDLFYALDNKEIIEIEIRNFATPEGYNDEAIAAEVTVPEETTAYKPAAELGDDILAFNVSIDGKIYTLPGAFTYFAENGWKLADKTKDKLSAKNSTGRISLLYGGGFNMDVRFVNPTDKANFLENLFVGTLVFEENFPGKVELPGGITLGMSHEDLKKAIESFNLDADVLEVNESSSYTEYTIRKKVLQDIIIYVKAETDAVYKIEVRNSITNLTGSEE